ncbi:palmitoyltransferase ZDHHC20-like [Pseudophryne corroboree]|uniref:palmitoyltransferase ZDHHC20-like n=1 Tax=Pseudophryne corroboree TaxID=495146 RepID=UPI003081FBA7
MLLQNLTPYNLSNGTQLKVTDLQRNIIEADILTGCGTVTNLVFFHLFFVMFMWSYWMTVFARPANPPKQFQLPMYDKELYQEEKRKEYKKYILTEAVKSMPISIIGEIRYCEKCEMIKPDHCHHCATCDVCVLKMDHHCSWVNNCIGFSNRKSFLLTVLYGILYFLFISGTVLYHIITSSKNGTLTLRAQVNLILLLVVSIIFLLDNLPFLHFHSWLLAKNMSTIDSIKAGFGCCPQREGFPLHINNNFREIFGKEKRYWLLPLFTSQGDGCSFPTCLVVVDLKNNIAAVQSDSAKQYVSQRIS